MLEHIKLEHILFLDIETVPQCAAWDQLPEAAQKLWLNKENSLRGNEEIPEGSLYDRAGIYAEFGRIVCISVGFMSGPANNRSFRMKSFYSKDETELLNGFCALLNKHFSGNEHLLCAHNGKEFDFPYIARRILINGLKLPRLLDIAGKKPWEVNHLDTMELWKFGDRKSYTSVALLTHVFNIPTPKDDIDGSQVGRVFWEEDDLDRIELYCRKDVVAIAQIVLRFKGEDLISDSNIVVT